ncbi:MAG: energy transducer TonB [Halarcobacter sp.]
MQQKNYFYISGVISIVFYLSVCTLLLLYINAPKPKKYDAFSKTTVLELELVSTKDSKNRVEKKVEKKIEKVVKKSTSKSSEKKADFKSLFANVKTTSKKTTKEEVNNVVASADPSRFKSKFEKQKKSNNISVSKLLSDIKITTKMSISTSSEHKNDPYYSKIYEILASRWTPIVLGTDLEAKVLVIITNSGKFDYRFIKYSNNDRFDESLKVFLDSQKSIPFPPHNKGAKTDIEVLFKSKE